MGCAALIYLPDSSRIRFMTEFELILHHFLQKAMVCFRWTLQVHFMRSIQSHSKSGRCTVLIWLCPLTISPDLVSASLQCSWQSSTGLVLTHEVIKNTDDRSMLSPQEALHTDRAAAHRLWPFPCLTRHVGGGSLVTVWGRSKASDRNGVCEGASYCLTSTIPVFYNVLL